MVDKKLITVIRKGGIGVMPTDTLYGLVGSALSQKTVERIYRVRKRSGRKPLIVLIASPADIRRFGVRPSPRVAAFLKKVWPGSVTVIIPGAAKRFSYLHPGSVGISFRVPDLAWLRTLLRTTGPLVAPSANLEGRPPAKTIAEAKKYFGERVDFYVRGVTHETPSTLLEVKR